MRAIFLTAFTMACLTGCTAELEEPAQKSTLFAQPWNSGLSQQEPPFHTQRIDKDTLVIRQSINTTFEAPFLYLIFGRDKALLIDTGTGGAGLRPEVDSLIREWRSANGRQSVSLVVMHSHGHSDHVGGDAEFAARPDTVVVKHSAQEVSRFFGIKDWPTESVPFDLGGRIVDILPTPGHQPAHVMVFDRATGILFSGDSIYPGRLYFQCARAEEYLASIERVSAFRAAHDIQWILGAHIEMKAEATKTFRPEDRARRDEHLLELRPSVLTEISTALSRMIDRLRVEEHDDFILFPHPADPRGKSPPDWCLTDPGA